MKMTILPQIRQNTEDNEESQQNSPANQQISLELNLAPARVAHVAHGLENELETPSKRRLRKRFREQNREKEIEIEIVDKPKSPILQPLATTSEEETGFNSEDEYEEHPRKKYTDEEWRQRDFEFARSLEKLGFTIKPMTEDGACLFRAIADQVYGDQTMHSVVRKHCMDYILKNRDFFCSYITEDINKYVNRKRQDSVHGNHLEIQAMSEMFHRTVEVYSYQLKPINIFHQRSDYEPIRLSYERASHYNSIVNPHNSTIGVGLGLSTEKHNELLLEQAMLEDKMKTTDWEATNEMIEEQVAKESYLQWCKDNEKRKIQLTNSTAGSSSTNTSCLETRNLNGLSPKAGKKSPRTPSTLQKNQKSPKTSLRSPNKFKSPSFRNQELNFSSSSPEESDNCATQNTATKGNNFETTESIFNNLPPEVFGLDDWENSDIIAQVLALSQQEYLDGLKNQSVNNSASN